MRLPMKPSQTPETTAVFLIFLAIFITVASTSLAVALPHHFQQLHHIGGAEEVHAHVLWTLGEGRDLVHIQGRGVGRQDGALLGHFVELLEHLLLDTQFLEHGFDDEVGVLQIAIVERGAEQRHALIVFFLAQLALLTWAS